MRKTTFLFFLLFNVNSISAEEWFSMARHGECVPLSLMAEGVEEFKGVTTPKDLIENYIKSGHKAEMIDLSKGTSYQINVDGNLKWILIEKNICREFVESDSTLN